MAGHVIHAVPEEAAPSGLRLVLTMGGIGLISSVLIVFTFEGTKNVIERNKTQALERAIFEVIPDAESKQTFTPDGGGLRLLASGEKAVERYYACYAEGELVGVAIEAAGQGFQDIIRLLYGYSPERHAVIGFRVLESKETPGLGDKIERDPRFLANFEALEVKLDDALERVLHPIELVKKGEKEAPYQIDAISGATISSRAVATILRESTARAVPIIERNLAVLKETKP